MIKFHIVRWKNFLSTGNTWTEIELDNQKMTLIVGDNGAGKSQLLDAITFALFNKPFRKINKPSLVNSINQKKCVVEIEFDTNGQSYKVVRGLKPAIFEIYQNNKLINQDAAARDYQEFLEKQILKTTFKSFTQIVILGSATFTPFMKLSAADRRAVLDDLLDIQIFSSMNVIARQRMIDSKTEWSTIENDIKNLKDRLKYIIGQIENLKLNSDQIKQSIISDIEQLENEMQISKDRIADIEFEISAKMNEIGDHDDMKAKLDEMLPIHTKMSTKLSTLSKNADFFRNHDHCPTCEQPIDENFQLEKIDSATREMEKLSAASEKLVAMICDVREKIEKMTQIKNMIASLESSKKVVRAKIVSDQKAINKLNEQLDAVSNDGTSSLLATNIQEKAKVEQLFKTTIRRQKTLIEERETLDLAIRILKDGGIKTQIVRQYLPIINKSINRYLNAMDFMVNFTLDESFNETIKSRYRDEFSYANFSEGEKARIDLSLLLTWRLIAKMRNSVNTNLLILDEVFDGSLDSNGSDELVNILKDVVRDCNVFVISHRENMKEMFDRTLMVKKKNNFSVVEE